MTTAPSPFHAGEQTIQHLAGARDRVERKGRAVIRDYMPEQHREFFAALMFMVVGMADQNGHPWAWPLRLHEFGGGESAHYQSVTRSGRSFAFVHSGWVPRS